MRGNHNTFVPREVFMTLWMDCSFDAVKGLVQSKTICQECAKLSSWQIYKTYFDLFNTFFGYYMIPYVLCHSFDVFTIILQHSKIKKNP